MLRLFAIVAAIVVVIWGLSVVAMPDMPSIEGHDITSEVAWPALAPLAKLAPEKEERRAHAATKEVKEKDENEKEGKGKKGGKGKRR